MLAKQLDDALCSGGGGGGTGDWKSRDDKCASCSRAVDGSGRTGPQSGMSLLDELEQAQAGVAAPQPRMVEVDLTRRQPLSDEPADLAADQTAEVTDVERWAVRLCDALDRRLELSADTRYRLLKLISTGVSDDGDGKPSCAVDLAELVRNRDGRVAELTCEVSEQFFIFKNDPVKTCCVSHRSSMTTAVRKRHGAAGGPRRTRLGDPRQNGRDANSLRAVCGRRRRRTRRHVLHVRRR